MGMFDYVNFKMSCPECGKEVHSWQTKDSACYMDVVEPDTIHNFYAPCDCGCWIEFSRSMAKDAVPREVPLNKEQVEALGFKMEVRDGGNRLWKKRQEAERQSATLDDGK